MCDEAPESATYLDLGILQMTSLNRVIISSLISLSSGLRSRPESELFWSSSELFLTLYARCFFRCYYCFNCRSLMRALMSGDADEFFLLFLPLLLISLRAAGRWGYFFIR